MPSQDYRPLFKKLTDYAYAAVTGGVILASIVGLDTASTGAAIAEWSLLLGFAASALMLIQWRGKADYPYDVHKRKAIRLWLLALPVTVLIPLDLSRWGISPVWAYPFSVVWFFLMTTLTFGVLPWYGGVTWSGPKSPTSTSI